MSTTIGSSNHSAAYKPQVAASGNSGVSPQQRLGNLFQQIDKAGTGRITKEQFDLSFNSLALPASVKEMGKEAVYKKLDTTGFGTVTKQDFINGMESLMNQKVSSQSKESSKESSKEIAVETKPTLLTPKTAESPIDAQIAASDKPPSAEGKGLGFIINTTA
jgi:hypothetical protein